MSLRKQTVINSIGSLILLGCQWVISILLVKVSGYNEAGIFALAMSIANVFSTFVNYGIRNYQVTDIEIKYKPDYYLAARIILSLFALVLCWIYLIIDGYSMRNSIAVLLYLSYNLSFIISDIIMGNLQRYNHLEINGYSNSLRGLLCLLLFSVAQLAFGELLYSMCAMSIGSFLILIIFDIPQYHRFCKDRGGITRDTFIYVKQIYKKCFFLLVSTIIPIIIIAVPRRDIQKMLGEYMLGIFSSIYTPVVILNTLIPSLILAVVPKITGLWKSNNVKELRNSILRCYTLVVLITGIALVIAMIAGRFFLQLMYSSDILSYSSLLYAVVVAIGLNCACVAGSSIMIVFELRMQVALFSGIALAIIFLFSNVFIRIFGIYGGAYVLILAFAVQMIMQLGIIVLKIRKACKE